VTRLISIIDPANERSLAVARRLGMAPLRDHLHHGTPVVLYAIECPAG
jgi:RimJ/RimL family protein N-acetyltransferase